VKGFQDNDEEMCIKFINDKVFSICPFWDIINISCMIKCQPIIFFWVIELKKIMFKPCYLIFRLMVVCYMNRMSFLMLKRTLKKSNKLVMAIIM